MSYRSATLDTFLRELKDAESRGVPELLVGSGVRRVVTLRTPRDPIVNEALTRAVERLRGPRLELQIGLADLLGDWIRGSAGAGVGGGTSCR